MKLNKILIVSKKTAYDWYLENPEGVGEDESYKEEIQKNYMNHYQTLEEITTNLEKHEINYDCILKQDWGGIVLKDYDIIISVGGDGTFLECSHHIFDKTPVLGINSDPNCSEGAYSTADITDFGIKLEKILGNDFELKKLNRLEVIGLNRESPKEFALNEVFIAARIADKTAKYKIKVYDKEEKQVSSGIIVSTGSGSTAWMESAGGLAFPSDSDFFQYLVREPFEGRIYKTNIVWGFGKEIEIQSRMHDGYIAIDSIDRYDFVGGEKIKVVISKKPLYSISF